VCWQRYFEVIIKSIAMKRFIRKWWWLILLIPLMFVAGFVIWAETPLGPMPEALAAMQSDEQISVETTSWFTFRPTQGQPTVGLIFYPGGRVDPRSYAPAARALAIEGYLVVIAPMPLNLAVFAPDRASDIISAYPEIRTWVIGGHSLGGSMAANFAHNNPSLVKGLFFWAAYPAENDDLSALNLQVVSAYGTLDGVANPSEVLAAQSLLSAGTRWVAIEGGNHAQFGWYGDQPGDNPAQISREEQQLQAIAATLNLLDEIEK
jgi:pimeloyl-ACP methyl ester carboxylesterase